ncbi:hypothetical protein AGMMS50267_07660 [Spirochaetia bacterium]|nr:hypothetical protein AGMMS50267_07630 [Spirochaetia bacterium]GHV88406.1 hypothetical protein AGMMS50267_07660 [Spirochaetia bacterium]
MYMKLAKILRTVIILLLTLSLSSERPANFSGGAAMGTNSNVDDDDSNAARSTVAAPVAVPAAPPPVSAKARYLELALYTGSGSGLIPSSRPPSTVDLFRVIKKAAGDKNIRGLIVNTSGFTSSSSLIDQTTLWELRAALEAFKSTGKKVIAFFDNAAFDDYCLLSVADKIVMDDVGTLTFMGYAYGRGYFQHTLEKLGIGVRELRYLNYKSAMETYTRSSLSAADRTQYNAYLDDIFGLAKTTVMKARSWKEADFNAILNREFLYSAAAAKTRGLVDAVGRAEAVEQMIQEVEGSPVLSYSLYGDADASLMNRDHIVSSYGPGGGFALPGTAAHIAIVYASGETDLDRAMNTRNLAQIIREQAAKSRVKAIVVRIDSPGGAADAADHLAEAIRDAASQVPVVVSMGPVAASGGYWAAMYASHIVASPYTLTGSIGVIGSWFYENGLYNKLGLSVDTLQRGTHAGLGTGIILPRRNLTKEEEARFRRYILDMYGTFVGKVAVGRNLPVKKVEALAQGRVYSGISAQSLGLVDSLGGLSDAIAIARTLAKIPETKKVVYKEYPKPTFMQNFVNRYLGAVLPKGAALLSPQSAPLGLTGVMGGLEHLQYRLSRNGQVMPILPLGVVEP